MSAGVDVSFDCPICFESYDDVRRSRVVWPCGHAICTGCDGRMSSSGLHMCPTCRTPRAGMSAAEATSHAEAARMRDIVLEDEDAMRGRWRHGAGGLPPMFADEESFPAYMHDDAPEHFDHTYTYYRSEMVSPRRQRPATEVLFFANQAQGSGPGAMLMELEQAVRSSLAGARAQQQAGPPGPEDAPSEGEEDVPRDGFNGLAVLLRGLVRPPGQAEAELGERSRVQSPARARPRPRPRPRSGQLHDALLRPPNNRRFRLADAEHPRNHPRHRQ